MPGAGCEDGLWTGARILLFAGLELGAAPLASFSLPPHSTHPGLTPGMNPLPPKWMCSIWSSSEDEAPGAGVRLPAAGLSPRALPWRCPRAPCSLLLSEHRECSVSDLPIQGLKEPPGTQQWCQGGPGCRLCWPRTPRPVGGRGQNSAPRVTSLAPPPPRPAPKVPVLRLIHHNHPGLLILGGPWTLPQLHDCGGVAAVQSFSRVWPWMTPWTAAHQASLSITISWSLLKLVPIELVMPFSSCPQSFPASGSFLMSRFFSSGGQRIGASASTSFLLVKSWDGGLIEQGFRPPVTGEVGKVFSSTPAALKCPCTHHARHLQDLDKAMEMATQHLELWADVSWPGGDQGQFHWPGSWLGWSMCVPLGLQILVTNQPKAPVTLT